MLTTGSSLNKKEQETILNEIVQGDALDTNKFKVRDKWYLNKYEEEKNKESRGTSEEVFDYWSSEAILNKGSGNWFRERITAIAENFKTCWDAKVKVVNHSVSDGYFGKKQNGSWDALWSYMNEKDLKEEKVDWQGQELIFKEKEGGNIMCQNTNKSNTKTWELDQSAKAKLSILKIPEMKELYFERVNIQDSGKKRTNGVIVAKTEDVKPHKGKIRMLEVVNGNDYIYVDWWFEHANESISRRLEELIKSDFGCTLENNEDVEEQNSSNCKGVLVIGDPEFIGKKSTQRNGNRKCLKRRDINSDCSYDEENLSETWEEIKLELGTNWLEVGQEIGVVWQGKRFKWRSF